MKKKPLASCRWQVDHTRQVTVDGRKVIKRYRESFDTARDADLRLLELKRRRLVGEPATPNNVELSYCFMRWHKYIHASPNHSASYRDRVNYAWQQLSRNLPATIRELKPDILDDYVAIRSKTVRPATILKEYRVLTACLNWCESRGVCVNPLGKYTPPRVNHQPPQVTRPDQLQAIFDNLRDDARKAFWFILATGCRFGEFAALTADDITPGVTLRIVGKGTHGTPRERNITMPQMPFKLPAKGLLFTLRDKRWNEQTLLDNIKTACTVAGLKPITIHHLRHCAATYKLAGGMNIYELMQHFGWRSFKIAQQYVDISRTVKDGNYLPKLRVC